MSFTMTRNIYGNQISQIIGFLMFFKPKISKRNFVMNMKSGFNLIKSTILTGIVISFPRLFLMRLPIGAIIRFFSTFPILIIFAYIICKRTFFTSFSFISIKLFFTINTFIHSTRPTMVIGSSSMWSRSFKFFLSFFRMFFSIKGIFVSFLDNGFGKGFQFQSFKPFSYSNATTTNLFGQLRNRNLWFEIILFKPFFISPIFWNKSIGRRGMHFIGTFYRTIFLRISNWFVFSITILTFFENTMKWFPVIFFFLFSPIFFSTIFG